MAAESASQNIKSPQRIVINVEGVDSNSDSDDENSSESTSSSSEEEEEEGEGEGVEKEERMEFTETTPRLIVSPQKRARGRHKEDLAVSRERNKVSRRPRPQFKSRRRPSTGASRSQAPRSRRKPKVPPRMRLDSGGAYSSTSEADFPVNGTSRPHLGSREGERISREVSKCSSVYETANEGYISIEEKGMTSPLSDSAIAAAAPGGIPKATGIEDLTARNLTVPKQSHGRGKKRKRNAGSSDRSRKKSRLESGSSADGGPISKSKTINGLVNGSGANIDIKPLDLVWAKCRGYPPYPALVRNTIQYTNRYTI